MRAPPHPEAMCDTSATFATMSEVASRDLRNDFDAVEGVAGLAIVRV